MTDPTVTPAPSPTVREFRTVPAALALVIFLYLGGSLLGAYLTKDTEQARGLVDTIKNLALLAAGFYLGSSASSRGKDQVLADNAKATTAALVSGGDGT